MVNALQIAVCKFSQTQSLVQVRKACARVTREVVVVRMQLLTTCRALDHS
jgi:hypothetical protein